MTICPSFLPIRSEVCGVLHRVLLLWLRNHLLVMCLVSSLGLADLEVVEFLGGLDGFAAGAAEGCAACAAGWTLEIWKYTINISTTIISFEVCDNLPYFCLISCLSSNCSTHPNPVQLVSAHHPKHHPLIISGSGPALWWILAWFCPTRIQVQNVDLRPIAKQLVVVLVAYGVSK